MYTIFCIMDFPPGCTRFDACFLINMISYKFFKIYYFLIYGTQPDPIRRDLLTPTNLLSNFWPNLIAILESREFSQTTDIIDPHPESINNPV